MLTKRTQEIIPILRMNLAYQPIEKAWIFGSCSRGEENVDSDVDLLVQYIDSDHMSLMSICRIKRDLEKSINRTVDLVEEGCLLPSASETANRDKILIYERKILKG